MSSIVFPKTSSEASSIVGGLPQFTAENSKTSWERPSDWLDFEISENDEKFIGIFGVTNDDSNYLAININTPTFSPIYASSTAESANSPFTFSIGVAMSAGRLYLLSIENHGVTEEVLSFTGDAGLPTFTSQATTLFDSSLKRLSLYSTVPQQNYVGNLTINFTNAPSNVTWTLVEVDAIDTTTNHGIVQVTTNTGSGTSATATLTNSISSNVTFGVQTNAAAGNSTPSPSLTELQDTITTVGMQTVYAETGLTTLTSTITSSAWAYIAVELQTYSSENCTVNWGDGNTDTVYGNSTATHTYLYGSLASNTLSSKGYRQAIVTITPNSNSSLRAVDINRSGYGTLVYNARWLDVAIAGPYLTKFSVGKSTNKVQWRSLERVRILNSKHNSWAYQFATCVALRAFSVKSSISVYFTNYMFLTCYSLQSLSLFDTSNVVDMSYMFSGAIGLSTIPCLNTSSVKNMYGMFNGCTSLKNVPLLNTSSVKVMSYMFQNCTSLTSVPEFDVTNVGYVNAVLLSGMYGMFTGCTTLKSVPAFNPTSVLKNYMFDGCTSLKTVPQVSNGAQFMFRNCTSLESVSFSSLSPSVNSLLSGCSSLQSVTFPNNYSPSLFTAVFNNCVSLPAVTFSGSGFENQIFTTFSSCSSLASVTIPNLKYSVTLSSCKLSKTALEELFESLGKAAGAQTVTITSNPGAASTSANIVTFAGSTSCTMSAGITSLLSAGMELIGSGISTAVAVTFQDSGDTVTRSSHGLSNDTAVSFPSITSTTGISSYTRYYVVNATTNTFQISDTIGGNAKTLTTNGSGTMIYSTVITSVDSLTTFTISIPASASSASVVVNASLLKRSIAMLKGWTVSG